MKENIEKKMILSICRVEKEDLNITVGKSVKNAEEFGQFGRTISKGGGNKICISERRV